MGIWRTFCSLTPQGPTEDLQPMSERTGEQWPSPSLLNLVLFYFGGFVCFVFCLCSGSEYLLNPSDPPLHVIRNILYEISYILKFHSQFYKVDLVNFFLFQEFKDLLYVDLPVCTKTCSVTLHPVDKLPHSQHKIKSSQSKLLYPFPGLKWTSTTMIYTVLGDNM